jgi:hypothetical protein
MCGHALRVIFFILIQNYDFLCLLANCLAAVLLLKPHLCNANLSLLGLLRVPMPPCMPPNLAAKLILRGEVPVRNGVRKLLPVVLRK